jgi:hypothetical protein
MTMGKMSKSDILSTTAPRVLWGTREIAQYLRVHRVTISRWISKKGLPVAQGPKLKYFTTTSLIDTWIVTLRKIQLEKEQKRF